MTPYYMIFGPPFQSIKVLFIQTSGISGGFLLFEPKSNRVNPIKSVLVSKYTGTQGFGRKQLDKPPCIVVFKFKIKMPSEMHVALHIFSVAVVVVCWWPSSGLLVVQIVVLKWSLSSLLIVLVVYLLSRLNNMECILAFHS